VLGDGDLSTGRAAGQPSDIAEVEVKIDDREVKKYKKLLTIFLNLPGGEIQK
jgi:hypothetical protein